MSSEPIPTVYFHIFATVNALATFLGALAALLDWSNFHCDLMPIGSDLLGDAYASTSSPRLGLHGVGVGIMYLIHASQYFILPRVIRTMRDKPEYQQRIMWWFIFCTWWPEFIQVFGILYHLPPNLRSPSAWGPKLGGKLWYCFFIMTVKGLYLAGVGVPHVERGLKAGKKRA